MEEEKQIWELFNQSGIRYKPLFFRPKYFDLELLPFHTYADWFSYYGVTNNSIELCMEIARRKISKHIDGMFELLKVTSEEKKVQECDATES